MQSAKAANPSRPDPESLDLPDLKDPPPEIYAFAKEAGRFIEHWGFKNVQGQIWAHLFLSDRPLDTAELMKRTKISKGLASGYIREMLDYDVILEASRGSHGTVYYEANPDQQSVIFNVLRKRERVMLSDASSRIKLCEKVDRKELEASGVSKQRIKAAKQLVSKAESLLDLFVRNQENINVLLGIK